MTIPSISEIPVNSASLLHSGYNHPLMRKWQQQNLQIKPDNLMLPVFVHDGPENTVEPIPSMPEQFRFGTGKVVEYLKPLVEDYGLTAVILFGVISDRSTEKDEHGSMADHPQNPVLKVIKKLKHSFPHLLIACDVCLCPYTSHGHCGILNKTGIDNPASIARLAQIACCYAQAGADIVAPSDMMDGRVGAIKQALYKHGLHPRVSVMSYSAKFASSFYGPFRDAAKSSPSFGDRKAYQLPPNARGLAVRAIERDVAEGADILMVKPGYPYLDIVRDAAQQVAPNHPIAVYQVSGEYSMLYHAANTHHLFDEQAAVMESLEAYLRAGAILIISYWTPKVLRWLKPTTEQNA